MWTPTLLSRLASYLLRSEMQAPSIEYVRDVMFRLSETKDSDETIMRDESGTEVAFRLRSGQFIALWHSATKELRIFDDRGRTVAG